MRYIGVILILILITMPSVQLLAYENIEVEDLLSYSSEISNDSNDEASKVSDSKTYLYEHIMADSENGKLGAKEFLRDTAIGYGFTWGARFFYVRNKNARIFDTSFSKWWDNITQFPEVDDGDSFFTNYVTHPMVGSYQYLYYRAMGHDFWTSFLGSIVLSTLFEYTVEGLVETPSLPDLISTPVIGTPIGVLMENISDWLIARDNTVASIAGHIINPMRLFIKDRDVGIKNIFTGNFFSVVGQFELNSIKNVAVDLEYPVYFESPLPVNRFTLDTEFAFLDNELEGQFIFYSVRFDYLGPSELWGAYIRISYSGVNDFKEITSSTNNDIEFSSVRDGFELANTVVGGKFILHKSKNYVLSGGLDIVLPTIYKDNIGRLNAILSYRRNFPIHLKSATTIGPYLSGAVWFWDKVLSFQGTVGSEFVLKADKLEGNYFEQRFKYGAAMGVNIPIELKLVLFVEFDGYTQPTASTYDDTDLFITQGIRFGEKFSPGFSIQFPLSGPTDDISKLSILGDFQIRF